MTLTNKVNLHSGTEHRQTDTANDPATWFLSRSWALRGEALSNLSISLHVHAADAVRQGPNLPLLPFHMQLFLSTAGPLARVTSGLHGNHNESDTNFFSSWHNHI